MFRAGTANKNVSLSWSARVPFIATPDGMLTATRKNKGSDTGIYLFLKWEDAYQRFNVVQLPSEYSPKGFLTGCVIQATFNSLTILFYFLIGRVYDATRSLVSAGPASTGSDASMALVSTWIQHCSRNHPECKRSDEKPLLPTRVIDVGPADGSREPFLFISNCLRAEYLILSHCWGNISIPCTTVETLLDRKVRIPLACMTQTFRDAVQITRRLGYQFLWVDSFCIIQDSRDDWAAEASKMADYYSSAAMTIAASASSNGTKGCFKKRDPLQNCPTHLCSTDAVFGREDFHSFLRNNSNSSELLLLEPLQRRAWAFQELILSPRYLSFGEQLSYTCLWGVASEACPEGIQEAHLGGWLLTAQATTPLGKPALEEVYSEWNNAVIFYIDRDITYDADVLPALSGIAYKTQLLTGDTYLAGLWKNNLYTDLLWSPIYVGSRTPIYFESTGNLRLLPGPPTYVAPSWSWASLYGRNIKSFHLEEPNETGRWQYASTIIEAEVTCITENPFGEVGDGKIRAFGPIKQARAKIKKGNTKLVGGGKFFRAERKTNPLVDKDSGKNVGHYIEDTDSDRYDTIWCLPLLYIPKRAAQKSSARGQQCLPLRCITKRAEKKRRWQRVAECLALSEVLCGGETTYRRVGLAKVSNASWFDGCEKRIICII
jgi:hypothetical protein